MLVLEIVLESHGYRSWLALLVVWDDFILIVVFDSLFHAIEDFAFTVTIIVVTVVTFIAWVDLSEGTLVNELFPLLLGQQVVKSLVEVTSRLDDVNDIKLRIEDLARLVDSPPPARLSAAQKTARYQVHHVLVKIQEAGRTDILR